MQCLLPSIRQSVFRTLSRPRGTNVGNYTTTQSAIFSILHTDDTNYVFGRRSFHKNFNVAREDQQFQLSDGRTMGFAEYGTPGGTAVFFLHGSPGSRYDGLAYNKIAQQLDVRIICPDRPGHGLSSLEKDRKLSTYAGDITRLAHHLQADKYHVVGRSGGGPFVVSCAHGCPPDELRGSAIIAGGAHPDTLTLKDAGLWAMLIRRARAHAPGMLQSLIARATSNQEKMKRQLALFARLILTKDEQKYMLDGTVGDEIVASLCAAYAQGSAGVLEDMRLCGSPWDFDLSDVRGKVLLFYGEKDTRTPVVFGQHYMDRLPNAELFVYEDSSHYNISQHEEEIWTRILKEGRGTDEPSVLLVEALAAPFSLLH